MEAGAERTTAANDLLGKSAVDMAAVLNTSVEETERLKQEAEDYGMVMSNKAVAASAAFEDSLTKLLHTAGGLKTAWWENSCRELRKSRTDLPTCLRESIMPPMN